MNKHVSIIFLGSLLVLSCRGASEHIGTTESEAGAGMSKNVNPLIGTGSMFRFPGNTFPAVGPPFAMTQWSAETVRNGDEAYYYTPYFFGDNPVIDGFIGSHYPSGSCMSDYGSVTLMAGSGDLEISRPGRGSRISRQTESVHPHYYAVTLERYSTRVEMTATSRCGLFRIEFPADSSGWILVDACYRGSLVRNRRQETDAGRFVRIDPENSEISGYNSHRFRGYFVARFDAPIIDHGTWKESVIKEGAVEASGKKELGAFARFDTGSRRRVLVRVGTSFISLEQARRNLELETEGGDFDTIMESTRSSWDRALGRVIVKGASPARRRIFYTALYHCLLLPREASEHGFYRSPFDGEVHEGVFYNDFSLWDTFRAEHPLLVMIEPARTAEMIESLCAMYRQGGWMPKWPNPSYTSVMAGTHADAVVADAWRKGVRDFDTGLAFKAMLKNATVPGDERYEARGGLRYYLKYGYLPADSIHEGTSRNLEFSYDDFCLAVIARAVGRETERRRLLERSLNYRNNWDERVNFMRGRNADGSFIEPFVPTENGDRYYTEGTAWQYTWFAPHDPAGLIGLFGGDDIFAAKLDSFFTLALPRNLAQWNGYYHHGNEPSHHAPYLFNWARKPWKTQQWVRKILSPGYLYSDSPGGLPENDDCGQMSAWYVFSAMGFYPVCPGTPCYAIGSPIFPEVELRPDNGAVFRLVAEDVSEKNIYIQSAELNGECYDKSWLAHEDILSGGELRLIMGPEPSEWATKENSVPPSLSKSQHLSF